MKQVSARELRQKTAAVLSDVRRGREFVITYRGKSVALISAWPKAASKSFLPAGFGLWKDRSDMRDVAEWLEQLRAPRSVR